MLRLELVSETASEVVYNYYPENNKEYGTIKVNKTSGDVIEHKVPGSDAHSRYFQHAISKIDSYLLNKKYPKEDIVIWN